MQMVDNENNTQVNNSIVGKKKILTEKNKKLIFYILMFAPLVLQVAIFYLYVNVSNIGLAFLEYDKNLKSHFTGLDNFSFVIKELFSPQHIGMFGDTFLIYACLVFIAMPIGMIFSFYIYKKMLMSEFFRVILFLPQIISAVAMTAIFQIFAIDGVGQLTGVDGGLLGGFGPNTTMATLIFYTLWMGFGGNILLYCGAMSGINESIVEACHLDGCGTVQEFVYITLPSIYPTIITFILIDIAGIFTNQLNLYTFFGRSLPEGVDGTIGYFIFLNTEQSDFFKSADSGIWNYSQLSAFGVLVTLVTVPVSLFLRRFMEKIGPSED